MAATSEPASGSVSAKAPMGRPGDARQIAALELVRTGERDRAAAEALHGEGEVGKPAAPGSFRGRSPDSGTAAPRAPRRSLPGRSAAGTRRRERAHRAHRRWRDISVAGVACFRIGRPRAEPMGRALPRRRNAGRRKMGRPNVQSGSCLFSSRSKVRICGRSPRDEAANNHPDGKSLRFPAACGTLSMPTVR